MKRAWVVILVIMIVIVVVYLLNRQNSTRNDVALNSKVTNVDTIIDEQIYQSYFSYAFKEPVFVKYVLYHGGGSCSRAHFKFHNDTEINTAKAADYEHSGYDEGHLADAEDFAGDCDAEEKTFRFYNCVPQTPHLNRGQWKHWETEIRKESQTDSLLIITGGIYGEAAIGDGVRVPTSCWKVAESLTSRQVLNIIICSNTADAECHEITLTDLETQLGYKLPLKN